MSAKEFDPHLRKMDDELAGWSEPAERLRHALANDELALYCQPIAALGGGAPGYPMAEVLVRLHEEEKALLPPGEFLPVFEHYRLMPDLDRWVLRKVLEHLAGDRTIPRFSINVSSQTLEDAAFPQAAAQGLAAAGVPASALLFEIGEADALLRPELSLRFANAMRAVGCGLMVGGFGRRAATFMPLKTLAPGFVKVDGVIVRKLLAAPAAEAKLKAIIRVAEVMRFQIIAEMVEEPEILARLKQLGVAYAQGFGVRRPLPIERLRG